MQKALSCTICRGRLGNGRIISRRARVNAAVHMTAVTSDSLNPFGSMHASHADAKRCLHAPPRRAIKAKQQALQPSPGACFALMATQCHCNMPYCAGTKFRRATKVSKFSCIRKDLTSKDSSYDTLFDRNFSEEVDVGIVACRRAAGWSAAVAQQCSCARAPGWAER